jgi:hypothetical protein
MFLKLKSNEVAKKKKSIIAPERTAKIKKNLRMFSAFFKAKYKTQTAKIKAIKNVAVFGSITVFTKFKKANKMLV